MAMRARRWLERAGIGLGVVVALVAGLFAVAWANGERALARTYPVADPPLVAAADAATVERGRHLFGSRGCVGCHAEGGVGKLLFDSGPVARIVPSNLTRSLTDPAWADDSVGAAIRHGVRPDGTPLVFMPVEDYAGLDDADTAAIVAYLRALPPSDNDPGRTVVRPLGRVLHLFGQFPMTPAAHIDHAPRERVAPPVAPTPEYGGYVAQVCTGCHQADFRGGLVMVPGTPPTSNLTPHPDALGGWTQDDFFRVMRTGVRPDGREMHPLMPWREFGTMTDVELAAVWAYLEGLPARE